MKKKTDRSPGIFLKTEFIPDKRIERRALDELRSAGLLPDTPGPVAIDRFCDMKWGRPESYEEMRPGVLGCAAFTVRGFDHIAISAELERDYSQTGRRRVRSTMAHEIGHALLHERLFVEKLMFDQNQGLLFGEMERRPAGKPARETRIVCRDTDIFGGRAAPSPWYEIQANKFMAAALLPKPLFYQVVEPFLLRYDPATSRLNDKIRYQGKIEEVSDTFDVSREMARIAVETYMDKERDKRLEPSLF